MLNLSTSWTLLELLQSEIHCSEVKISSPFLHSINLIFTVSKDCCAALNRLPSPVRSQLAVYRSNLNLSHNSVFDITEDPYGSSSTCHHPCQPSTIFLLFRHGISVQLIVAVDKINLLVWFDFQGTQFVWVCGFVLFYKLKLKQNVLLLLKNLYADKIQLTVYFPSISHTFGLKPSISYSSHF